MPILADVVDAVIGADTHRDTHTLEMCTPTGVTITTVTIANTEAGFTDALSWISEHAPGPELVAALEGTRSYGIGLARVLTAAGIRVVEAPRPKKVDRRGRGKSDPIDANHAALHTLRTDTNSLSSPRADGVREGLRILVTARRSMVSIQTAQICQLRALLLTGNDAERDQARGHLQETRLKSISRRRGHDSDTIDQVIRRQECRRLALAIIASRTELTKNKEQLTELVAGIAPRLQDMSGVGPVSAAQVIISWSHPGRCRNEAAFASLAGVSPIPASSGQTTRYRLNRGGDRALNRALHDITITRWRMCPRTHAYINRRRAEGKTDREIRRCLKRYIARQIHRELTNAMA